MTFIRLKIILTKSNSHMSIVIWEKKFSRKHMNLPTPFSTFDALFYTTGLPPHFKVRWAIAAIGVVAACDLSEFWFYIACFFVPVHPFWSLAMPRQKGTGFSRVKMRCGHENCPYSGLQYTMKRHTDARHPGQGVKIVGIMDGCLQKVRCLFQLLSSKWGQRHHYTALTGAAWENWFQVQLLSMQKISCHWQNKMFNVYKCALFLCATWQI